MRSRIMVVGRDVGQRAQLARLLTRGGYRVEIAESASHACRIGFDGIALAIVAPDGLGPELDFGQLAGIAGDVYQAVDICAGRFCNIWYLTRRS